jgi:hypothetical protein
MGDNSVRERLALDHFGWNTLVSDSITTQFASARNADGIDLATSNAALTKTNVRYKIHL